MINFFSSQLLCYTTDSTEVVVKPDFNSLKRLYNSLKYATVHPVLLTKNRCRRSKLRCIVCQFAPGEECSKFKGRLVAISPI